ncbi:2-isopropylmalate synthase [bacterium]|nr:2-isopropylmalate synthase [bacterium]
MARTVKIFDTTLRDGEQAPRCSMNLQEKVEVARQLERLGVDVIEAGFPAASPGDLAAVRAVAEVVKASTVAALCRASRGDIDAGLEALANAARPRIHTFIATSPIHMEFKLKMTPDEVLARAVDAVSYARERCPEVEFSAEDAFRSDPDFVCKVFGAVIAAGATVLNIPDTVGYALPGEFGPFVAYIKAHTPGIEKAAISVHCHNDLGLAVANTIAAVQAGADQIECTINGLGERAGNASLEELAMILTTRREELGVECGIVTPQIYATSRLVSKVTGVRVQPNKAIVGENAFAHEAGIHQHGVLANRATYEIMTPESVGFPSNRMVLGKHSGKHAFEERLKDLGFEPAGLAIDELFARFKVLADKKKTVSDRDIEALVVGSTKSHPDTWTLDRWVINSGSSLSSTCTIKLKNKSGEFREEVAVGDGPIDAAFSAIDRLIGKNLDLDSFELGAVTGGEDAQGEATVKVSMEGQQWNGRGLSTDIVEASILAYIAAINSMEWELSAMRGHLSADAAARAAATKEGAGV